MKFFAFLIFNIPLLTIGQTIKLPEVIKPSPQSSEMTKYIDYPMDLSSGLASTNIPIYSVNSGSLTVPISLSYHASGLKPNEAESGVIGLGWNLNAFGVINRSINKDADERNPSLMIKLSSDIHGTNTNVLQEDSDVPVLDAVSKRNYDMSPDIFSYSLPNGLSGKFVFKRSNIINEFLKPMLLPFKPIKITAGSIQLDYFDVIDEKGNNYRFGKSVSNGQTAYESFNSVSGYTISGGRTSWLLTEIVSVNKQDTIYFEYDDVLNSLLPPNNRTALEKINIEFNQSMSNSTGSYATNAMVSKSYVVNSYTQKKITMIKFKAGYVKFTYKSNVYPEHLLDKIEVFKSGISTPFKTFKFTATKYHNISSKLNWYKLDELGFYDSNNVKINKYNFEYKYGGAYGGVFPDQYIYGGPLGNTLAVDFWGYYNGANNNQTLLPSEFTWNILKQNTLFNLFGSANRTPEPLSAQTGILKKIIFPTGGERIFEYEGNKGDSGDLAGGLRVKSIINKTNGAETKRTFTYFGYSKKVNSEYFKNFTMSLYNSSNSDGITNDYTVSSSPNVDININGRPVVYYKVNEYDWEDTINNGWVEHLFDASILERLPIFKLRTIQPPYFPWNSSQIPIPLPIFSNNVIFGDINENVTSTYNNLGVLIKTVKNNYSQTVKQQTIGFTVAPLINYSGVISNRKSGAYNFYNYDIKQLSQKLDSVETIEYLGGGTTPLTTKEEYVYNDNLFITQKTSTKSDGSTLISKTIYPDEVLAITSLGNDNLTSDEFNAIKRLKSSNNDPNGLNKISEVIQTSVYEDINSDGLVQANELLNVQRTNYKDWGNNNVLPQNIQTLKGEYNFTTNNLQDQIVFNDYYSNGNVKEVSKVNGIHIVYIWGYNGQYPISKIENATYSSIPPALISQVQAASDGNNENTLITKLNNLRNGVPNAMITNYTYIPLVGVSSVTDPKGYTTYYSYDSSNRLQYIKDHDGNVLQKYCYNYQGQQTDCTITYKNISKSGTYIKQGCTGGQTGSSHLYTVAAGVYSSTVSQAAADALAQADVTANGQNYANANGTCIAPLPGVPTGLAFSSATTTSINFSWTAVAGATSYKLYRNGTYISTVSTTTGSFSALSPSTLYNVQVLATNASGDSILCTSVSMSTNSEPTNQGYTLSFSGITGICNLYKNGSMYVERSTSGTSSGALATGDTFYVRLSASTAYYKAMTITSSTRGVLYNYAPSKSTTVVISGTFTKLSSEQITITCTVDESIILE